MSNRPFRQKNRTMWMGRFYENGARVTASLKTTDYQEACRILKDKEGDVAKGIPVGESIGERNAYTFEEATRAIVNDYRNKGRASTADVAGRIENHLAPVFGGKRMADITATMIADYTSARRKAKAERATVNRELAALRRMFRLGVLARRIHFRPHIEMLVEDNARQGFFERDDFNAICQHLPEWMQHVMRFAYCTGWRVQSEVARLEWREVDEDARVLRLSPQKAKNKRGRVFPYDVLRELAAVIDARAAVRDALRAKGIITPHVFCLDDGAAIFVESLRDEESDDEQMQPFLIKRCRTLWRDACAAAHVPGRLLHDFRRTAVRNLVRAAVPEKQAMTLTGHKTRSVFDRYDIVNEADLRVAVGKLDAASTQGPAHQPQARSSRRGVVSLSPRD